MNPQIPYPADRVIYNPINVMPGNFPGRLDVQVPQPLIQFLPLIGTTCIEAIQSRYQENNLRRFLFNQMCQNNYNNPDFFGLVKLTAQYIEMAMNKGMYRDIQTAITDSSGKMAELLCVNNTKIYPGLINQIDQSLYQRSQAALSQLDRTMQELNAFYSGQQPQGYPQQQNYPQQPQNYPQQGNYNVPPPSPYPQNFQQPAGNFYGTPQVPQQSQYGQSFPVSQPNQAPSTGRSYLIKPEEPVVRPAWVEPAASPFKFSLPSASDTELSSESTTWKPSENQPFNIVFNGETHELCYEKLSSLELRPFTKKLIGDKLMERIKHFKSLAVDTSSVIDDATTRSVRSSELATGISRNTVISKQLDIDTALSELGPDVNKEVELISIIERNVVGIGDEQVWKFCDMFLLENREQYKKTVAYGSCAMVNDPLVTNLSPTTLADKLLEVNDFFSAQNILKDAKASAVKPGSNIDELTIVNFFNKRITERLNRFTQQQLALDLTIDSFIDEGTEIISHIEKNFQEKFSNPLRLSQKKIIYDACNHAFGSYHESLVKLFIPEDNTVRTKVTFFFNLDYFISINCFSWDLKFTLPSLNYSSAIFEENTPILYKLATLIFEEADTYSNDFNRCLIRTLDRTVYALTRSVIDTKTFLITKVS